MTETREGQQKLFDALSRPLRDLRMSLTDRCNFRCPYCMPIDEFGPHHAFLRRDELLTTQELVRTARLLVELGVEKIRLTGGEPLLRSEIIDIVGALASLDGVQDMALTTNGSLLTKARAQALADAGLQRVTVSLDALSSHIATRMNGVGFPVDRVLRAVDAALAAGLSPVKVNVVVRRGWNEEEILPIAERFRGTGVIVRFIEYMDVGTSNGWRLEDVVPAAEILRKIGEVHPLEPVPPRVPGEVATRYRYLDGMGEIGVIHSVSHPFCGGCNRLRLTADGELYTCLFATNGKPLKPLLRSGASDEEVRAFLAQVWHHRRDAYSAVRTRETKRIGKVEMSRVGG
ncbi:GTP 3',8-cyclase MoaA [Alicyclobacillus sacchari]|nr:GTP 3',8-cyclase MoaA [Alicyclobacillus sacchari]